MGGGGGDNQAINLSSYKTTLKQHLNGEKHDNRLPSTWHENNAALPKTDKP